MKGDGEGGIPPWENTCPWVGGSSKVTIGTCYVLGDSEAPLGGVVSGKRINEGVNQLVGMLWGKHPTAYHAYELARARINSGQGRNIAH